MTIRLALVLLVIVPAAMAYPWDSPTDWWVLSVGVAVVLIVSAWWRGQFVTTMIARRIAVWRRNRSKVTSRPVSRATVVLRVEDPVDVGLPLPVLAGYVERFGVRCDKVRITSRDLGGTRATWITLTVDAAANLAALQARSPELPLRDTADIVGRRLAHHLRESGLTASIVDVVDSPVAGPAREMWRGVRDERGVVSAYGIPVDDRIIERLGELRMQTVETWTALEFGGTAAHPTMAAVCALRTTEALRDAPLRGLVTQAGRQGPLLAALDPKATERLEVPAGALPAGLLERIAWPVGSAGELSRT